MEEFLEELLKDAIKNKITDLHFRSRLDSTIYMRYHNEITIFKSLHLDQYQRLLTFILFKAKIDFNELSIPQTGAFQMNLFGKTFYFRLSYIPSVSDIHLVLRILNHENTISFHQLSERLEELEYFRNLLMKEKGLIVICGPTGSGKSTTLHCFLEEIKKEFNKNILTIEDPIEIYHKDIIQIQVNEQSGLTFENVLDQILRHDPDVIMVGELRNPKTAQIAINLAMTGHLVLTTLHASNGILALKRLKTLGIKEDDLYQVMLSFITQRLFYNQLNDEPFVVFEIMDKQHFYSQNHTPLESKILYYYQKGWIDETEYKKHIDD